MGLKSMKSWLLLVSRSFTYDHCFSSLEPSNDMGTQVRHMTSRSWIDGCALES